MGQLLGTDVNIDTNMNHPIIGDVQESVEAILRTTLMLPNNKPIYANSHLRDDLGLDSFTSMELLVGLEDSIEDFFVNPENIEPKHFNTVETMASYVAFEQLQLMEPKKYKRYSMPVSNFLLHHALETTAKLYAEKIAVIINTNSVLISEIR